MKIFKAVPIIAIITLIFSLTTNGIKSIVNEFEIVDYNTFMNIAVSSNVEKVSIFLTKIEMNTSTEDGVSKIYRTENPHSDELLIPIKKLNTTVKYDYSVPIILGLFCLIFLSLLIVKLFEKNHNEKKELYNTINNGNKMGKQQIIYNNYGKRNTTLDDITSNRKNYFKNQNNNSQTSKNSNNVPSSNSERDKMTNISSNAQITPNQVKVKFSDVAGVDEAKVEVQEIVDFLKNPKRFTSFGIRVPRGLILYGKPGTGKTLLAKAIAGEAGVPFYSLSGSDFVEMYVGVGASRIRSLFENARQNKPCIIFIDEIDALARKRGASHNSNEEKDQTLNQLLVEMDGFQDNDGIVLIGATNRLDILDPAVLRPHRFDRHVEVPVPDKNGRIAILKLHAKNKKLAEDVRFDNIANKTTGFSGAELENLLNEAALLALRKKQNKVTNQDIDEAISKVMVGLKKNKNNLSQKEKKIVAYHEAGHAIATKLLAKKVVEKITILPTSNSLGYVIKGNEDEQFLYSQEELFQMICIALAGRASEKIYFSESKVTNGASNDFQKATSIAKDMVFSYGMSSLGNINLSDTFKNDGLSISDNMKDKAFDEVQNILKDADKTVTEFLKKNDAKVQKLVNALLEKETLYKKDVDRLLS